MPDPTGSSLPTPLPDRLSIEPLTEALLDQVGAIEQESFPDPWPRRFFQEELTRSDPAYARVAIADGQVVGYLVAWFVLDEVHLGNLAVHQEYRRRGVGRFLLQHLIEQAERRGASFISLEVRAGNRAAMSLYARHHFRPEGLRKGYYAGREDAVIMVRECGSGAGAPGHPVAPAVPAAPAVHAVPAAPGRRAGESGTSGKAGKTGKTGKTGNESGES